MISLRLQVLKGFKQLHRTRLRVFSGDEFALTAARNKINEEFSKNKNVSNEDSIKALLKLANEVEVELRTRVIQAKEVKPGIYEAKILDDTIKLDNVEFDEFAKLPQFGKTKKCKDMEEQTI